MKPRPYQVDAIQGIHDAFERHSSALAVLPTGAGKTVIMSHAVNDRLEHGRAILIAHREELIHQAAHKLELVTGHSPDIEMASQWADLSLHRSPIIVSSVQTLCKTRRLNRFDPMEFGTLLIDEAHHAVGSSYRNVIEHFTKNPDLKVLGVTATPDRLDKQGLGKVFETCAFNYGVVDAVRDGWLVPIRQRMVQVEDLDFSGIRTVAGDLNQGQLEAVMTAEGIVHKVVTPTVEIAGKRKTLVFCTSIKHAEITAEVFNRHRPGQAMMVHGGTPKEDRKRILAAYAERRFQFLVNVGVFTEGFDDPGVEVVVMARPTKSRSLYAQCVGRGTRPLPGIVDPHDCAERRKAEIQFSNKPYLEVIDFVGNAGQHKLVTSGDVLAGEADDRTKQRAAKIIEESDEAKDVMQAMDEARAAIIEDEIKAAEEAKLELARKRAAIKAAKAFYTSEDVDPFNAFAVRKPPEFLDSGEPATDLQTAMLERNGIPTDGVTKRQATKIIEGIIKNRAVGGATYKQKKLLARYGYDPNVTFTEAKRTIDLIAQNGWRKPVAVGA